MIGYVALAITVIIMVSLCAQIDNWRRDWTSNFAETSATAAEPELHPVTLNRSITDVAEEMGDWAGQRSGWELVEQTNGKDSIEMHLTRTTRLFHFVDDIHVSIKPDNEGGCVVNAKSRSRVGKGDLGQNPRNLKSLLAGLRETQPR